MGWYITQLIPRTHWTEYGDAKGTQHFCIWKQWLGRCYQVIDIPLGINGVHPPFIE